MQINSINSVNFNGIKFRKDAKLSAIKLLNEPVLYRKEYFHKSSRYAFTKKILVQPLASLRDRFGHRI